MTSILLMSLRLTLFEVLRGTAMLISDFRFTIAVLSQFKFEQFEQAINKSRSFFTVSEEMFNKKTL